MECHKEFQIVYLVNLIEIVEDKSDDYEKRIKELEKRPIGSGGGADISEINNLLADYMKKNDFEDYLKRLEKCEKKSKKAKDLAKKN